MRTRRGDRAPLELWPLVVTTMVLGCTAHPVSTSPDVAVRETALYDPGAVRQVPVSPITSNTIVLAPGQRARFRTLDGPNDPHYMCSGAELVCDRLDRTLYCICPGAAQRR